VQDLATIALRLPDVQQGVACAGTALESRTFTVAGKAFLFVSAKDARLKLTESVHAARERGFVVGANGWTRLPLDALPPAALLRRWIAESHAAMRPPAKPAPRAKPGPRGKPRR
jgi:hypothetical protein